MAEAEAPERASCSFCHQAMFYRSDHEVGIHQSCMQRFGLQARPPSRRLPVGCARCEHPILIRCLVRERGAQVEGSQGAYAYLAPLQVTFAREVKTSVGFFWAETRTQELASPDFRRPVGMLETYVCQRCGFTEWFTVEPEKLPIGPEYGTVVLDATPASPYR